MGAKKNLKKFIFIDPLTDLGELLLSVEKPGRYTGGEYGRLLNKDSPELTESALSAVIAFPDLYEIGMSNQALKILYNRLNGIEGVFCDRSFAPAPDFEGLLRSRNLPLYGLDTGISLGDVDLLMFTLGYELLITGLLTMLDVSDIPLRRRDRGEDDPLVIMGGPCVSNPLPYADFVDAFWIGEAEGGFFELAVDLRDIKKSGGKRDDLLKKLVSHPSVWASGKAKAVRAVDNDFSDRHGNQAVFPVPSMKVVHHHGAVEIMRGCQNGCRFCHAGYWYRPARQKSASLVEEEAGSLIKGGGYREITLSSLSSADYQYLEDLLDHLNAKYSSHHVSFQLPSLRVSSFSLNLLEKISMVRKSGLTFAVETPSDFWQMAINKQVSGEDVVSILREAKKRGWKGAKFYFMIGLPLEEDSSTEESSSSEEAEIAAFVETVARQTRMSFNINIGTFVPKPHTPFQWARQISAEEAEGKLAYIRNRLKPQGHKVGIQDPLISIIEGIASRGDERAGAIFEEAFKSGCRLDSWTEFIKKEIWGELLGKHKSLIDGFLSEKGTSTLLPWSSVCSGLSEKFYLQETEKAHNRELTYSCIKKCNNCGICDKPSKIVQNSIQFKENSDGKELEIPTKKTDPDTYRIIFSFSKQESAVFHPHLGLLEIFYMAFLRADIPVIYTQGFNPLPKLEIASPLSLGIKAGAEIASIETDGYFSAEQFKKSLNEFFPGGLQVVEAMNVFIPSGGKKHSLSSLLWGYVYTGKDSEKEIVEAKEEKSYREARIGSTGSIYSLERLSLLASLNGVNDKPGGASYFEVYRSLYPGTGEDKGKKSHGGTKNTEED